MTMSASIIRSVIAPLWAIKERSPYLTYVRALTAAKTRPADRFNGSQGYTSRVRQVSSDRKQRVATEMSRVQSVLDGMLLDRPRRNILRRPK